MTMTAPRERVFCRLKQYAIAIRCCRSDPAAAANDTTGYASRVGFSAWQLHVGAGFSIKRDGRFAIEPLAAQRSTLHSTPNSTLNAGRGWVRRGMLTAPANAV
jgi:hypothetical protein